MITTVKIDMKKADDIIESCGLQPSGMIQKMLTNEIARISDPYVPFDTGMLKNQVTISIDGTWFQYNSPYARYHWFGKLMVDPITKKGAFFKEGYGHWSRPDTQKILTETPMKYSGSPMRGPKWAKRAWDDNQEQILSMLERKLNK